MSTEGRGRLRAGKPLRRRLRRRQLRPPLCRLRRHLSPQGESSTPLSVGCADISPRRASLPLSGEPRECAGTISRAFSGAFFGCLRTVSARLMAPLKGELAAVRLTERFSRRSGRPSIPHLRVVMKTDFVNFILFSALRKIFFKYVLTLERNLVNMSIQEVK